MIQKLLNYIVVIVKLTTTFCIVWLAVDLLLWYGGSKEFNRWTVGVLALALVIGVIASVLGLVLHVKDNEAKLKASPDWQTRFPKATDFTVKEIADGEYESAMKTWQYAKSQHGKLVKAGSKKARKSE